MAILKSKIFSILFLFSFLGTGNFLFGQIHCGTAAFITVNGVCVNKSLVTAANSFEQPNPSGTSCGSAPAMGTARDVWAKFTAIAPTATITGVIATAQNIAIVTYSAPCNATVAPTPTLINVGELACANANNANVAQTETATMSGLTIGTDYFIRIINTNAANATINLCVTSSPLNDEPTGATGSFSLTTPSTNCSFLTGNNKGASQTTCGGIANPSCGNYGASSVDTWYSVTVPANGNLFLQTKAATMTQAGIATYTGTPCSSLSQIGCSEGNPEGALTGMPSLYVSGQTPGSIVYIRVWNKNGQTAGTFSICATNLGPCGNLANNDFCSNPAPMSPSAGSFSSSTTAAGTNSYTPDFPGDLPAVALCSNTFEHNSWYSFIATAATQTFAINTSTTNCAGGLSVQVFSVALNTYGCCKTFTAAGGACVTYTANGTNTLSASSLNIGTTYYIMMESFGGPAEACTYTVTGWSATGILPIELVSFTGTSQNNVNFIEWVTSSEKNNDYYMLERSSNGKDFGKVSDIKAYGDGSSTKSQVYQTYDSQPNKELTYYRLKQTDLKGNSRISNIISVIGPDFYETIYNLYPNPTTNNLNFEYYSKSNSTIYIELSSYTGSIALTLNQTLEEGLNTFILPMSEFDNGVYILKVVSEKSGKTTHHKVIKN